MASLLRHHQISVPNICNGRGTCGKCKVRIVRGAPEPLEIEYQKLSAGELAGGIRLACQVQPCEDMEIICGPTGSVDRKEGLLFAPQICGQHSGLRLEEIDVDLPSLEDERGDWDRLSHKLQEACSLTQPAISLPLLQTLAPLLRQENFSVTVALWNNEVLAVRGKGTVPVYGVAIDIGTTNIAVALYDLTTGQIVRLAAAENGQTRFGADVISRIEFSNSSPDNRASLRQAVIDTINGLLAKLCTAAEIDSRDILKAVIVGNTTMHHLFLGLDVSYLALSPFVSVRNDYLELNAAETKLELQPQAKVLLLPNIAGFVGADTLGAIWGAEDLLATGCHLLIDIGTNCELYLQDGSRMWACSTAAGPAFEGAGITYGMRAQPGAIERVTIDEQGLTVTVIGGGEASGICGSGLIEAIQQMRRAGIITQQGTIIDPEDPEAQADLVYGLKDRIRDGQHGREFVLFYSSAGDDIVLTQRDISQLQLAKGAVCAGIRTLLDIAGLTVGDLESIVLAGTFAAHLNLISTMEIGLIPQMSPHKLKTAGNAAHAGAVKALLDQRAFNVLRQQASNIVHVELGGSSIFSQYFMESMYIEPYKI
ncbi:MAG TPA: ASKHA domain-containing protein [Methylomusa anaerophila]|uniref:Na(+)-translocating NADH-quinone reductase subunit F n=1 Tax=Methylomusa anaerophila TaxID=1930071 RepID=A0A348AL60_9FIRM|nr:ASKHA domain-containing protein [Methylomusa anaerophila]BBB91808.1 Na(+)-translocating NADH-quinone reductase subunit F [Methylomusa anaerophila]HML88458.1 ASKHA domain-containing protein [Methylomusa anaerophila]